METKKIIQINPALLRVSDKTRKNRSRGGGGVTSSERSERSKVTSANLVKKQILNKIRQNYREKGGGGNESDDDIPIHTDDSDFESSVEYFNNLKKKMTPVVAVAAAPPPTVRHVQPALALSQQPQQVGSYVAPLPTPAAQPQYGCLKGGSLPTFRNWQKTQKNPTYYQVSPASTVHSPRPSMGIASGGMYYQPPPLGSPSPNSIIHGSNLSTDKAQCEPPPYEIHNGGRGPSEPPSDWQKEKARINEILEKRRAIENSIEVAQKALPTRKRKITRRTYHVGKSKIHPKVSVLLSNKTIRSQIMTEKQHYNEIPINDVKQYLQKKGLIKIGSNSPNHVLRSMYESAMLLGGDIVNHNKDTLLHNFIKGVHP